MANHELSASYRMGAAIAFPKQNSGCFDDYYTTGNQLGSGAFSVVVEGTRLKDQIPVAVKIVSKENTNAREMNQELSVMSKLHHENIVNFLEIFDEANNFHVVMERVTGGELFDRIVALRRYTERDASSVMIQALKGLKHMHERQFVHRDLKPENLLLSSKEPDAIIKLADFGFAASCEDDDELFETLGTPPYMAPELVILRNENPSDPGYNKGVDIWALGVCLYILLSGIHPFQIEDEDLMLDRIESFRELTWLGPNWDNVSQDAKTMLVNMIHGDPHQRWNVDQCLQCSWITGNAPEAELTTIRDSLRQYQAKKKFKGAIFGVMATNKMKNMMASLPSTQAPAPPKRPLDIHKPPVPVRTVSIVTGWNTLKLEIVSGTNLASKDSNGFSDPYIKLWCGAFKYKSKVVKKTLNPVWHQVIEIPAKEVRGKMIEVECWDWDLIGQDDFMGEFEIDLEKLALDEPGISYTHNFPLLPAKRKTKKKSGEVSGSIRIIFTKMVN